MKKILLSLFGMCLFVFVSAQTYTPNTRWPYLFENFTDGTIYFSGNKKTSAQLNIHLWGNVLHYVSNDGRIFETTDRNIIWVEIGADVFLYGDNQLMRLVAEKGNNVLLCLRTGDFDSMNAGTGAYGASLNSSAATDLSSLDLGGLDKPALAKMQEEKNTGRDIPMRNTYYYVINGHLVEATKKDMTRFIGEEKEDVWKSFLKTNKIKWKKEDSLKKVLDFFITKNN